MEPGLFEDGPADTREEILAAAYRSLCEHGYPNLTIQRIGEGFEKSPSLVYHHYDSKDELLVDLLEYLLDRFETTLAPDVLPDDPAERLELFVDASFRPDSEVAIDPDFLRAMIELRAQAAHDPAYRDHFERSDAFFDQLLVRAIDEGISDGVFAETDSRRVAVTVRTASIGAAVRRVTTEEPAWEPALYAGVREYLDSELYVD